MRKQNLELLRRIIQWRQYGGLWSRELRSLAARRTRDELVADQLVYDTDGYLFPTRAGLIAARAARGAELAKSGSSDGEAA